MTINVMLQQIITEHNPHNQLPKGATGDDAPVTQYKPARYEGTTQLDGDLSVMSRCEQLELERARFKHSTEVSLASTG